jgi:hypothetical protein
VCEAAGPLASEGRIEEERDGENERIEAFLEGAGGASGDRSAVFRFEENLLAMALITPDFLPFLVEGGLSSIIWGSLEVEGFPFEGDGLETLDTSTREHFRRATAHTVHRSPC